MDGSFGSAFQAFNSSARPFETWQGRVLKQIQLAEEFGLKVIPELGRYQYQRDNVASLQWLETWVSSHATEAARIFQSPAFWGFEIRDEPSATDFPALRNLTAQVGRHFRGALRFVNLLPNYASAAAQMKAANYTDYVDRFVETLGDELDMVSFDHYPFFERARTEAKNTTSSPAGYRANLQVIRAASKRAQVPFWNYINVLPTQGTHTHSDPTPAQLSWQVFTSLAYGAKGVLYFCYWSPAGGFPFGKGGGIIYPRGSRTSFKRGTHYEDARRINSVLRVFGNFLLTATSTGVYRVRPHGTHDTGDTGTCRRGERDCPDGEQPNDDLTLCATDATDVAVNSEWPGAGLLIGQFRLADGRIAVLLHNQNFDFAIWPTVNLTNATEINPASGGQAVVLDDSPYMPGLQLSFGPAEARLFVLESYGSGDS